LKYAASQGPTLASFVDIRPTATLSLIPARIPIVPIAYTENSYCSSLKSIESLVTFLSNTIIIDIEFKVEFVVSANVNISMGMTYWYKNAKRYVYSIMVFDRKVTSDSITLTCDSVNDLLYNSTQSASSSSISEYLSARLFATDIKLDEVINGIAEELKNMMEIGTTYISDKSDLSIRLEDMFQCNHTDLMKPQRGSHQYMGICPILSI